MFGIEGKKFGRLKKMCYEVREPIIMLNGKVGIFTKVPKKFSRK